MSRNLNNLRVALAALAISISFQPVLANVKAGVEAWERGDYDTAVNEWRSLAINGDADAQFNLGQAYKMGRGVDMNLDIALDWYGRAANQGHLQAADSYGHLLHYMGRVKESLPFLEASASRGDPRAQYLFATELFNGVDIEKDWIRAYAMMTRASAAGMEPATRSVSQMDKFIPLPDRQQGLALAGLIEQKERSARTTQTAGFDTNNVNPVTVNEPVSQQNQIAEQNAPPITRPAPEPAQVAATQPAQTQAQPQTQTQPPRPRSYRDIQFVSHPVRAPIVDTPAKKRVAPPPPPSPSRVQPANGTVATSKYGKFAIQLGAFSTSDNAKRQWQLLSGKVSDLNSLSVDYMAAGPLTRLRAGGFASRNDALQMCALVKAVDQDCIPVTR